MSIFVSKNSNNSSSDGNVLTIKTVQIAPFRTLMTALKDILLETNITFESEMLEKRDLIFSFIMKYGIIQDKFDLTEEMINAKECYKNDNVKIDYLQDFIDKHYKIVPFVKKEKIEREISYKRKRDYVEKVNAY